MKAAHAMWTVVTLISACGGASEPGGGSNEMSVSITPAEAKVLTCSTFQFSNNDPASTKGAWSVASGRIDATGRYTAPLSVPASPDAEVLYTPTVGAAASATAHLATAHPGSPIMVETAYTHDATPYEHALTVHANRVYAVYPDGPDAIRVMRSDDGGATFTARPAIPSPTLTCATAAVDAGNPDVLYVVSHSTSGSKTSVTVRVSEDGGQTFPANRQYVIADSILDGLALAICPDIVSPSADHVLVTTAAQDPGQTKSWTATYASANRGASFGSGAGTASDDYFSSSDTNLGASLTTGTVLSDGGQDAPRAFSDGKGHVCTSYAVDSATGCEGSGCIAAYVQCSADSGATWSPPTLLASTGTHTFPTGAFSSTGNVAITWTEKVNGAVQVKLAISRDAGVTFAAKIEHPFDAATFGYTDLPTVQWQGDILWLEQTTAASDDPRIAIDKTCDFGASWSGALAITQGSDYLGAGLIVTSTGVAAAGRGLREAAGFPLSLVPLTP
jgi:hypothetical protein